MAKVKSKQIKNNEKPRYNFCIPIQLIFTGSKGEEKLITLDILGYLDYSTTPLFPIPADFRIIKINEEINPVVDKEMVKSIGEFIESNPIAIREKVSKGINQFALECLKSEKEKGNNYNYE